VINATSDPLNIILSRVVDFAAKRRNLGA